MGAVAVRVETEESFEESGQEVRDYGIKLLCDYNFTRANDRLRTLA